MNTEEPSKIDDGMVFITKPDCIGLGRIVVGGRYYSLPVAAVLEYEKLREENARLKDDIIGLTAACDSLEASVYALADA